MSTVLYETDGHIATITLNRPDKMNTMGDDLLERAHEALAKAASDDEVRVVIFTGAGRAFCAGGDLDAMSNRPKEPLPVDAQIAGLRQRMMTSQLLHEMPKPTIAAINGACAGAGFSWACACDLRFAAKEAKFTSAFLNAGLSGDFGGTWSLTQILGSAKARELYMLAEVFDGEEAERIGLVSKAVPREALMDHVRQVAEKLVNSAPIALKRIKANLNDAQRLSFGEALDHEADRHMRCAQTDDHIEAAKAFLEKRKPVFHNR